MEKMIRDVASRHITIVKSLDVKNIHPLGLSFRVEIDSTRAKLIANRLLTDISHAELSKCGYDKTSYHLHTNGSFDIHISPKIGALTHNREELITYLTDLLLR